MKIIVTHLHPDIDAISSIWMVKRFMPEWDKAKLEFVTAGRTFRGAPPDDDSEILHVDTGLGKFDHHQEDRRQTSATQLVFKFIKKEYQLSEDNEKTLERYAEVVTEIDNGRDITWAEAGNDRNQLMVHNFLSSWTFPGKQSAQEKTEMVLTIIDAIFQAFKNKIKAEREIAQEGQVFKTPWGKALAIETGNNEVLTLGEKLGYVLVAKKNPKDGHLKIFARWDKEVDLTLAYEEFLKKDPNATWYLHPSKCMLLNGSRTDPELIPTKLSLKDVVQVLKRG